MVEHALIFRCGADELIGILHAPEASRSDLGVVVVVGGPQYRVGSHRQFILMARSLAAGGYPVFRFDYRGMGDSGGAPRNFESVDADLKAAIDAFCDAQTSVRRVVVFGLCDAASATLMYCRADSRVQGLILANPWVRTEAGSAKALVRHYYVGRLLQRSFWLKFFSGKFSPFASLRSFFRSLRSARKVGAAPPHFVQRMLEGITGFGEPVLLLLSDRDLTAREFQDLCRDSQQWSNCLARSTVRSLTVENADHTFSSTVSLNRVSSLALNWLQELDSPR